MSDVVLSSDKVDYPMCTSPDVLVCMSTESANRYVPTMKPGGILMVDEDLVPRIPDGGYSAVLKVPATRVAAEEMNRRVVANVIMLGALNGAQAIVSQEAMEKAVLDSAPTGTEELNLRALRRGCEIGEALLGQA